jgi:hypothetical protein
VSGGAFFDFGKDGEEGSFDEVRGHVEMMSIN